MASKRSDKRTQESLAKVLPQGTIVRAYAGGPAHARLSPLATGIIVTFTVVFAALAVTTGRILVPGVFLLLFLAAAVRPHRGCAVTNRGLALVRTRIENHEPKELLLWLPTASLLPPNLVTVGTKRMRVQLGSERVSLRTEDYQRLVGALGAHERFGPALPQVGRSL